MASSEWAGKVERAGFFGATSIGGGYEWYKRHAAELSVGSYGNDGIIYYQVNIAYRYTPWRILWKDKSWRPIQAEIFGMHSLDQKNYFSKSPKKYPTERYYEQTALRWGVGTGTAFGFLNETLILGYSVRLTDAGLVALYNNTQRDLQYTSSSGLRLEYRF